ncbi:hypothetical protein JCM10295v2_002976 [Rhodotorula toruloides]
MARFQDLPDDLILAFIRATAPPRLEQEYMPTEWQMPMPAITQALLAKLGPGAIVSSVCLLHMHLGGEKGGFRFDLLFNNLPNLHTFRHYRTLETYQFTPFYVSLLSKPPHLRRFTLQRVALRMSSPLDPLPITELELLDSESVEDVLMSFYKALPNLQAHFITASDDEALRARPICVSFGRRTGKVRYLQARSRRMFPGHDEGLIGDSIAPCLPPAWRVFVYPLADIVPYGSLGESIEGLIVEYDSDCPKFPGFMLPPPPPEVYDIAHFVSTRPPKLKVVGLPVQWRLAATADVDPSNENKQTTEKILAACAEVGLPVIWYEERGPLKVDLCDEMRTWIEEKEEEEEEKEKEEGEVGKEAEGTA